MDTVRPQDQNHRMALKGSETISKSLPIKLSKTSNFLSYTNFSAISVITIQTRVYASVAHVTLFQRHQALKNVLLFMLREN